MRIPAMRMDSTLMGLAKQLNDSRLTYYDEIDVTAKMAVDNAFLSYHNDYHEQYPGRPYMRLYGKCMAIKGKLPNDITSLTFSIDNAIDLDPIYEFSNDELVFMTKQGMFNAGFKVPDELRGVDIYVPVKCALAVIEPEKEDSVPLVFVKIYDNCEVEISSKNTNYEFGYKFEALEKEKEEKPDVEYLSEVDFTKIFGEDEKPIEKIEEKPVKTKEEMKIELMAKEIRKKAKEREERINAEFEAKLKEEAAKRGFEIERIEPDVKSDVEESVKDETIMPKEELATMETEKQTEKRSEQIRQLANIEHINFGNNNDKALGE